MPYQSGGKGWINSFKSILPANWKVVAAQAGAGVGLQENKSGSGEGILTQDLFELQPGMEILVLGDREKGLAILPKKEQNAFISKIFPDFHSF